MWLGLFELNGANVNAGSVSGCIVFDFDFNPFRHCWAFIELDGNFGVGRYFFVGFILIGLAIFNRWATACWVQANGDGVIM